MATIGELAVNVVGRTGGLTRNLRKATKDVRSFTATINRTASTGMRKFTSTINSGKVALGGLLGATSAAGAVGFGIKLAADAEKAEVAFKTLLGSGEQAKTLLEELRDFSTSTPFQFGDLQRGATQLVAFGTEADQILPTLKSLGDIAAGTNQPIAELADLYGKARVQGRLFAEDINQFTGRGVPIIGQLAKQFGVAESEIKTLASEGKIHFSDLRNAIASLTSDGGKFAGLMEAQSKTAAGAFSTLKDNVQLSLQEIGTAILEGFDLTVVTTNMTNFIRQHREGFVNTFVAGMEVVRSSLSVLADGFNLAKAGFLGFRAVLNQFFSDQLFALEKLATGWQKFANSVLGMNVQIGDFFTELRKGLNELVDDDVKAASRAFDAFKKGKGTRSIKTLFEASAAPTEPLVASLKVEPVRETLSGIGTGFGDLGKMLTKGFKSSLREISSPASAVNTGILRGSSEASRIQAQQRNSDPRTRVARDSLKELKDINTGIGRLAGAFNKTASTATEGVLGGLSALGFIGE